MKLLLVTTPYLLSFLIGYLFVQYLQRKEKNFDPLLAFFWAGGAGLGFSALITFFSFLVLNHFSRIFVIALHLMVLAWLLGVRHKNVAQTRNPPLPLALLKEKLLFCLILLLALIPALLYARAFPLGGWDAWSVWNFKAKFLLLSGNDWKNIFDPSLWRSSPHYPLFLPMVILWGWSFIKEPVPAVPCLVSLIYAYLIAGLLFLSLARRMKNSQAVLAPLMLLTLPFYAQLVGSQYCDIVLSYYLLGAVLCGVDLLSQGKKISARLCGIFVGALSFTKSEGTFAALVFAGILCALMMAQSERQWSFRKLLLKNFFTAAIPAGIVLVVFQVFYSPGNLTFVNGLFSPEKPVSLYRFQMILAFLLMELQSGRWNGIWLLLILSLCFTRGACFSKRLIIIPLFLALDLAGIAIFYFINTYFEIRWWLQFTLNRVLFSLLPLMVFWVFSSFFPRTNSEK